MRMFPPVFGALAEYPDEDSFSGLLEIGWDNGRLKYRGEFKAGKVPHGQHLEFWPTGTVHRISYWDQGEVLGTALTFREDGSREFDFHFGLKGRRNESCIQVAYGHDGEVNYITKHRHDSETDLYRHEDFEDPTDLEQIIQAAIDELHEESGD